MRRFNLFSAGLVLDEDRPAGYRRGAARVDTAIGPSMLAGKLYDLPPGQLRRDVLVRRWSAVDYWGGER